MSNINHYYAALAVFSKWLTDGIISEDEYSQIDDMAAMKYGISSRSIYRRNSLTTFGSRANMEGERRLYG